MIRKGEEKRESEKSFEGSHICVFELQLFQLRRRMSQSREKETCENVCVSVELSEWCWSSSSTCERRKMIMMMFECHHWPPAVQRGFRWGLSETYTRARPHDEWWSSIHFSHSFIHLRSSTFVRSPITYFRIRREESIKTAFFSRFGIDTQGRAWSTDLRISINRSLIGSFRRWNSNDPVSGLTCPYTRSSFWLAAAAQETIVSIEFSFNDRSNVIYESKQDEEGEGEGEAERESICVW